MLDFPRWKVWTVTLVVLVGILLSIPSLLAGTRFATSWPGFLPQEKINLGLDLAGGSHLLLEADSKDTLKQQLQAMEDNASTELRRAPRVQVGDYSTANGRLSFEVRDPTQLDAAVERMRSLTQPVALSGSRDWDVQVMDGNRVVMIPTASGTQQALKNAMSVARDVVSRRIDPGGTKEITVITEGDNRNPCPGSRSRGPGGPEKADRSDRPARVQAGGSVGGSESCPTGSGAGRKPGLADG